MISLTTQALSPAKESPSGHDAFFNLLHLVSDPVAAKKRCEELVDATLKANDAIREANQAQQELAAARKAHEETLRRERAGHQQTISQSNAAIAARDQQVNSQLAERERAIKKLEAKAADDAKAVSKLRADLERRLATIREAAAS